LVADKRKTAIGAAKLVRKNTDITPDGIVVLVDLDWAAAYSLSTHDRHVLTCRTRTFTA